MFAGSLALAIWAGLNASHSSRELVRLTVYQLGIARVQAISVQAKTTRIMALSHLINPRETPLVRVAAQRRALWRLIAQAAEATEDPEISAQLRQLLALFSIPANAPPRAILQPGGLAFFRMIDQLDAVTRPLAHEDRQHPSSRGPADAAQFDPE